MRPVNFDSYPHLVNCFFRIVKLRFFTLISRFKSRWWGINLGQKCFFMGLTRFRRHPISNIVIGSNCKFNSTPNSTLIGVNRPCIISTLKENAVIQIGDGCGFSGTVIGCAKKIILGQNVRCGANTLITDTDWHSDDYRTGPDAPIEIRDNVWLGVNVVVLKGVTIGENTLVGAGSLVTKSLPAGVVAGGVPAKVLRPLRNKD